jgi:hypothetical protein
MVVCWFIENSVGFIKRIAYCVGGTNFFSANMGYFIK